MRSWQQVEGWFTENDARINEELANRCPNDGTIVTLGVHHGRSMLNLAEKLYQKGKTGVHLVGIDYFLGDTMARAAQALKEVQLLQLIRAETAKASKLFADRSIFAVFLDAGHEYDQTIASYRLWESKIQCGGLFTGHDYQKGWPGVVQAVDEVGGPHRCFGTTWLREINHV